MYFLKKDSKENISGLDALGHLKKAVKTSGWALARPPPACGSPMGLRARRLPQRGPPLHGDPVPPGPPLPHG